jgi:chaperonin GroES
MTINDLSKGSVLPSKIIVKEVAPPTEKKTESGLILPQINKKNPQVSGKVLLTGSGTTQVPMIIKEGQTVLYTPLSGQRFQLEDEELVLLDQANILFFFNE